MRRQELEFQADRIEMVLRDYKAPARVTGGHVTPRWIQFLLQTAPGIKVNRVESLSREIALALGAPSARVTTYGGAMRVEVPRPDPQPVRLMSMLARLPHIPFGTAVLGLADDGAPLLLRLPSPDVAHGLVAGTTGSGKTALVQAMVASLALTHRRSQLQFVVIDELHTYRGLFGSHVANVIRRLRRVCRHYGADPVFICASATIANPGPFAEKLVGLPFIEVTEDGSPQPEKAIVFWNPPLLDAALGQRASALAEASYPAYDANQYQQVANQDTSRFMDPVISSVYEPGSVNKVITAAAALQRGIVTQTTGIHVPPTYRAS